MTNQAYNRTLKALGIAAGISSPLHSHASRHTFAAWMVAQRRKDRECLKDVRSYKHNPDTAIRQSAGAKCAGRLCKEYIVRTDLRKVYIVRMGADFTTDLRDRVLISFEY